MQANHTLAKQIITQHPHALLGLEQLTDIRERTKRRKRKRKKNGKGTERVSVKARHPPTVCIHNGPRPHCMRSSATRQSFQDHKLSRSMQIIPQKPVLSVGIPPMRTVHTKGCSFSVRTRTVGTRCTLIWLARGILACERSYFGKTGVRRAPCQCTLMPRTKKPKQCACKGTLSCGGVQMEQASGVSPEVRID